jgi:hypothetical protein
MTKIIILINLIFTTGVLNANTVYDLTDDEYKSYQIDPTQISRLHNKKMNSNSKIKHKKLKKSNEVESIMKQIDDNADQTQIEEQYNSKKNIVEAFKKKDVSVTKSTRRTQLKAKLKARIDAKVKYGIQKAIKVYKIQIETANKNNKLLKLENERLKKELLLINNKEKEIIKKQKNKTNILQKINKVDKKIKSEKVKSKKVKSKKVKNDVNKFKNLKFKNKYIFTLLRKLNVNTIQKENIEILSSNIIKILEYKKIDINSNEIVRVLNDIKENKLSMFEANIYIDQLKQVIKN